MELIFNINMIVDKITLETQEKAANLKGKENKTFRQILDEELEKIKKAKELCKASEAIKILKSNKSITVYSEKRNSMIAIKEVAKKMTLDQFNKRFTKEVQGVRDSLTGKMHFCPNDLGFKLTRANCEQGFRCKECWEYAEAHLKSNQIFKEKLKYEQKSDAKVI